MMIYTGNALGKDLDVVEKLGMGIMIASSATMGPRKEFKRVPCAIDNGAFQCWRRGFPFQSDVFRKTVAKAYEAGISLDFLVCPDIVGGGLDSLDFSMEWATGELVSAPRLALAVQDGMKFENIDVSHARRFTHIFVGGSVKWKWETAAGWVSRAHGLGMKCHIGQVGTLERLQYSDAIGADSVDSTSFVRNKSWHIVEAFHGGGQRGLFTEQHGEFYEPFGNSEQFNTNRKGEQ